MTILGKTTVNLIINTMKGYVENKQPVSPDVWIESAAKLNLLIGDEHDKLFDLQQKVAQLKSEKILDGMPVSQAKILIEATDIYREAQKQKAIISQVEEFIRIAKIRARLLNEEFKGY